jgi:hypothetical protein
MRSSNIIYIYYFGVFALLFFFTLNLNYVEGDDASTVLYHLCKRNSTIQKPYAGYNSGIDFIIKLSGFKTEESIRIFAIFVSFISGLFILIACKSFLETFFENSDKIQPKTRTLFYFLLPFIVPDILFHSLIINSTNISFVFILYSLIYFINFLKSTKNYWLFFSVILFAIAIPLRWTMLVSIPVYLGLLLYFKPLTLTKETLLLYLKVTLIALFGLVLTLYFIYITGYNLQSIHDTILSTTGYLSEAEFSVLSVLATASAFLTPALLLLLFFSLFNMNEIQNNKPKFNYNLTALILLTISPFFLFGFFPSYKFLITIFPILLILMVLGFDYLIKKKIMFSLFLVSLVSVWFLGIQIDANGTFCGPGFELNTKKAQNLINNNDLQNVDGRVKINNVNLKFDSGFYMPMLEGPRPLYGYFYVFFNRGWFNQIEVLKKERQEIVSVLIKDKRVIFFQDRRTAYISCALYQNGYKTATDFLDNKSYFYRDFVKGNDTIKLNIVPNKCLKVEWISNLPIEKNKKLMYRSSYSSEILQLSNIKKNKVKIIGPFTAILK